MTVILVQGQFHLVVGPSTFLRNGLESDKCYVMTVYNFFFIRVTSVDGLTKIKETCQKGPKISIAAVDILNRYRTNHGFLNI